MKLRSPRKNSIWTFKVNSFYDYEYKYLEGKKVRVIQPYGCPKNGTMGMCYVELAEGLLTNKFIGLVSINSLVKG